MMLLKANDRVLFIGDSITATKRVFDDVNDLGKGYVQITSALLQARYPEWNLNFLNRGIGGNRVSDLEARLEQDVISLKPTVVSILVGINDTAKRYRNPSLCSPIAEFEACYQRILSRIKKELNPLFVLMEPFVLPVPDDRKQWREDLDPKIQAVHSLAKEFKAILIPLDQMFKSAISKASPSYWAPDGVHPSPAGHALISEAWIQNVAL